MTVWNSVNIDFTGYTMFLYTTVDAADGIAFLMAIVDSQTPNKISARSAIFLTWKSTSSLRSMYLKLTCPANEKQSHYKRSRVTTA